MYHYIIVHIVYNILEPFITHILYNIEPPITHILYSIEPSITMILMVENEWLIGNLTSEAKPRWLMQGNSEAEGRGINARLTTHPRP